MTRDNTETEDRIELFVELYKTAKMEGKILHAIDEHGSLTSDGTLDIESVMEHVGTESGSYVFEVFGRYGRVVRYTDDVDEPRARFLREGSTDNRRELNDLIREHGVVGADGGLDIETAKENLPDDAGESKKKALYEMVGRYTRICAPMSERPDPAPTSEDNTMSEKGLHSVGEAYASGVSVTRGKGDDVFVKADDSVLLLDKAQANHLLVALEAELVEDDNE